MYNLSVKYGLLYSFSVHFFECVCVHVLTHSCVGRVDAFQSTDVEVRGQLRGVRSLLSQCVSRGSNSGP